MTASAFSSSLFLALPPRLARAATPFPYPFYLFLRPPIRSSFFVPTKARHSENEFYLGMMCVLWFAKGNQLPDTCLRRISQMELDAESVEKSVPGDHYAKGRKFEVRMSASSEGLWRTAR